MAGILLDTATGEKDVAGMIHVGPGPDWLEPRLPAASECSIGQRLIDRARADRDEALMAAADGSVWTSGEAAAAAQALAGRLQSLGVKKGDRVAIWQPNGRNMLAALFACSMLGAVAAQVNIALRGAMLTHVFTLSDARVLICHGELVERLDHLEMGPVKTILATEAYRSDRADLDIRDISKEPAAQLEGALETLNPWDLAAFIFTSGTTGPSKAVRVTCCQLWSLGQAFFGYLQPSDRILLISPLFHIASMGALWGAMSAGAKLAVVDTLRPADFWDVVRRTGATANQGFPGSTMELLMKAPPSPRDRDHRLRRSVVPAGGALARAFTERFGVDLYSAFSMTETSGIAVSPINPTKERTVGRPRKGLEVRLVDENDVEVPIGQPGELLVRSDLPWVLNDGYERDFEATGHAWRNGWFHTGDLMRIDEDGDLFYIDRLKDTIRRRGENISSSELEAEVRAFPSVAEAAAIGVPTPDGQEVLVVVEPQPGEAIDPAELIGFLIPRLAHFMVPRFVRVSAELPRTATRKVRKSELRATGLTPDTWDRETAGFKIRRQALSAN